MPGQKSFVNYFYNNENLGNNKFTSKNVTWFDNWQDIVPWSTKPIGCEHFGYEVNINGPKITRAFPISTLDLLKRHRCRSYQEYIYKKFPVLDPTALSTTLDENEEGKFI